MDVLMIGILAASLALLRWLVCWCDKQIEKQ